MPFSNITAGKYKHQNTQHIKPIIHNFQMSRAIGSVRPDK